MQSQTHTTTNDDDLQAAKRQFTRWRASHLAGTRIPAHLWSAASELANVYGVSRTARTLGLDFRSLTERAKRAPSLNTNPASEHCANQEKRRATTASASIPPEYVELSLESLTSPQTCVVEIAGAADVRLRLDLKGYTAAELNTILCLAWNTARCSS